MRVILCSVALGGWYAKGIARMVQKFDRVSPGFEFMSWINTLPQGAPSRIIVDGYDYTAYCAKPFALGAALDAGADIAILMDAAFYPARHIQPLVRHIGSTGYYLCRNGFKMGEWCSDQALVQFGLTRDEAMEIEEISSYCVGVSRVDPRSMELVRQWKSYAADGITFPGPHTNTGRLDQNSGFPTRNPGFVSADKRVNGHRHDQTALSVTAHRMGMTELVDRPRFTAYLGHETDETVLVNQGGL